MSNIRTSILVCILLGCATASSFGMQQSPSIYKNLHRWSVYNKFLHYVNIGSPIAARKLLEVSKHYIAEFEEDSAINKGIFCQGMIVFKKIFNKEKRVESKESKLGYRTLLCFLLAETELGKTFYKNKDKEFYHLLSMTHYDFVKQRCSKEMLKVFDDFIIKFRQYSQEEPMADAIINSALTCVSKINEKRNK